MTKIIIEGDTFDVPEEDDWTLGELAEFSRLQTKWGVLGATIALVWIVKHRQNAAYTIEQAEKLKVADVDDVEEPEAPPLDSSDGSKSTSSNSPAPSENQDGSGLQPSESTTA